MTALAGRPLVVVVERHFYEGCNDFTVADTSVAYFFDVAHGPRRVLRLEGQVVYMTSVDASRGDTMASAVDTLAFRSTYYYPNVCRATCDIFTVYQLATKGASSQRYSSYGWNQDSTEIVGRR